MKGETKMEPVFSTDNLPEIGWKEYRKKVSTRMMKISGPFVVQTSEGLFRCEDGYLAIDARGYPYAIATNEHALIYEEI